MSEAIGILHQRQSDGREEERLGPYGIETLIPREQEGALTAYRVRIAPHQSTVISYHLAAEELYFVLSGSGVALLNGVEYPLHAGDFLRLPPGTRHGFVTGEEELVMLDVHAPGSRPDRDVYFEGPVPEGFGSG
jgi:mannose-6-phosphate isomerase-like protein (cupin superfamily)